MKSIFSKIFAVIIAVLFIFTFTACAKGSVGLQGEKGEQGIQGEKGERGEQGIQGIQGEQGIKGEQGIQGIQGEQGIKGEQGIQGIQGEQGIKGEQGIQGIQGIQGEQGIQGIDGRGILNVEIIDGHLWITYTDNPNAPVDLGSIYNNGEEAYGELVFVLQDDGTYGVKAARNFSLSELIIPEKYNEIPVTAILDNAFKNKTEILSVKFPNTLVSIGKYAFSGCTGLTNVEIPQSTLFIGAFAFYNSGLESANLPNPNMWLSGSSDFTYKYYERSYNSSYSSDDDITAVSIKNYKLSNSQNAGLALSQSVSLAYMTVNVKSSSGTTVSYFDETFNWYAEDWVCNIPSELVFVLNQNGTFSVKASEFADDMTEIVIPPTYKGKKVTSIAESGFSNLVKLETVIVPDTVTEIGASAFSGCTNLAIEIPESVKVVGASALYNVKEITVKGINSWTASNVYWSESFGDTTIDYGNKTYSSMSLSAETYSKSMRVSTSSGGDYASIRPYTGIWRR